MKVIIKDIPQEFVCPLRMRHLENVGKERGITVWHRGNKIDLEIDDRKLAEKILKEKCGFVF